MSKRKRNKNKVVAEVTTNKVEQPEVKEFKVVKYYETEEDKMKEKKSVIEGIKEFGDKLPKPVKVVGGILGAGAALAGGVMMVVSALSKDDDKYSDVDLTDDDFEEVTTDDTEESTEDVSEEATGTTEE